MLKLYKQVDNQLHYWETWDKDNKTGIVHIPFGKMEFSVEDLLSNLEAVQESIDKNRPSGVKGKYWRSFYICSTMGPSIELDVSEFRDKVFN